MVGGVCGGLGEYFGIDPVIFRIIFVVLAIGQGMGVLLYIILMLVIPQEPKEGEQEAQGFGKKVEAAAQEIKTSAQTIADKAKKSGDGGRTILALVIIGVGVVALLQQFFAFRWLGWGTLWPLVLVALGLFIILKRD